MEATSGEAQDAAVGLAFDRRLKLEFHGTKITSDGGLLACRELDDALGLSETAGDVLTDTRTGANGRHTLVGQFRQSVFGRLAGYEDVNDADRLAHDPAMRWVVGGAAVTAQAASTSQMGRFETEVLTQGANLSALTDLSGRWIDRVHARRPVRGIVLDMDSSVSPTHGEQEGSAYNGHYGCTCYHPLFVFNQFGDLERCALRPGNVHSAEGYQAPPDLRPSLKNQAQRYPARGVGVRRLDHFNCLAVDVQANREFFERYLGFRLTERIVLNDGTEAGMWLTCTNKSYDFAYTREAHGVKGRFHHVTYALDSREDILRAADIFLENGVYIETGPHKHAVQQTFFLYVYEPGGNRVEVANAGARLVLAPDWKPITWTEEERKKGQAWGLKTIESFHTHGTPPLPDQHGDEVVAGQDDLSEKGIAS